MITGEYVLTAKCDNPTCEVAGSIESPGKTYSQARMGAIRANWKITKKRALCPHCRSKDITLAKLKRPPQIKCVKCDTRFPKTEEEKTDRCPWNGSHDFRPLSECHHVRRSMLASYREDNDKAGADHYRQLLEKYGLDI